MTGKYHFIGIGGIGMSALARILLQKGYPVSGSDIAITPIVESLIRQGAIFHKGQSANNIHSDDIVVYSSDIKIDNPEFLSAKEKKCALMHRSDLLAKLISGQKSLAVAGTHGKTTTSALLAAVLGDAGEDPSFAIGGILPKFQGNSHFGKGEYFVLEADESDQTFLKYHPFGSIVTNIDSDHLVNYNGNLDNLVNAFQTFMNQVQSKEHLFWCGDNIYLKKLNIPGKTYGSSNFCDWQIFNVRQEGFKSLFDLQHRGTFFKDIDLSLIGLHNAVNAAGVFAMAYTLGINEHKIRMALCSFQGVKRRCEIKGLHNNILFLDDYAHHPTEIETTLNGIRRAIGRQRLVAVFQPHRYSRISECLGMFGSCFTSADEVLVTDIYSAGEQPIPSVSSELVIQEIRNSLTSCQFVPRSAISRKLSECLQQQDVVVTLGAGDITNVSGETLVILENSHSGR